jgi:hypothetical protein
MRFHANHVSTSVDGDYYAAMFAEEDTDDSDLPYLIIQRQFEEPEDETCYIETHDQKYSSHFLVRRIEFTPQSLLVEFDRPSDNLIGVTFHMEPPEFAAASRVMKIIGGEIEPEAE